MEAFNIGDICIITHSPLNSGKVAYIDEIHTTAPIIIGNYNITRIPGKIYHKIYCPRGLAFNVNGRIITIRIIPISEEVLMKIGFDVRQSRIDRTEEIKALKLYLGEH